MRSFVIKLNFLDVFAPGYPNLYVVEITKLQDKQITKVHASLCILFCGVNTSLGKNFPKSHGQFCHNPKGKILIPSSYKEVIAGVKAEDLDKMSQES